MDFDVALRVLRSLEAHGVRYKVIGGVAMNIQGLARATRDLDIFVDPSDDNIGRLRDALREVFDDPNIDEITAADLRGEYPAIQYVPPVEGFHIDILARLGAAFDFAGVRVERRSFDDVVVPVATKEMLLEMKGSTVRPRDRIDCEWLRSSGDEDDGDQE